MLCSKEVIGLSHPVVLLYSCIVVCSCWKFSCYSTNSFCLQVMHKDVNKFQMVRSSQLLVNTFDRTILSTKIP